VYADPVGLQVPSEGRLRSEVYRVPRTDLGTKAQQYARGGIRSNKIDMHSVTVRGRDSRRYARVWGHAEVIYNVVSLAALAAVTPTSLHRPDPCFFTNHSLVQIRC
jgi:hypothetical protein